MRHSNKIRTIKKKLSEAEAELRKAAKPAKTDQFALVDIANCADMYERGFKTEHTNNLYYVTFGAYGEEQVFVWADSAGKAIDEATAWLSENHPEEIVTDRELQELYREAREELGPDASEEEVMEHAEADLYFTDSGFILDWTIDDVTDPEIVEYVKDRCDSDEQGSREPDSEADAFIEIGGGGSFNLIVGQKFLGSFDTEDEALAHLREWTDANNYFPALWFIDDHGGAMQIDYEGCQPPLP